jgi:hypothetical protein
MRRRLGLAAAVAALAAAPVVVLSIGAENPGAAAYDETAGPLDRLPPGWLWIPRYSPDSWRGAYHDSVSGAFVSFDRGRESNPVEYWRHAKRSHGDDRYERGRVASLTFEWLELPAFRNRIIAAHRADLGLDASVVYPEPGTYQERIYPPDGAVRIAVVLSVGGRSWPFEADLCGGPSQRDRIHDLLLGEDRVARNRVGGWRGPTAVLPSDAAKTLVEEPTFEAFVRRYGQGGIDRPDCDGLELLYPVRGATDSEWLEWHLTFDRERRFLRKDLRNR